MTTSIVSVKLYSPQPVTSHPVFVSLTPDETFTAIFDEDGEWLGQLKHQADADLFKAADDLFACCAAFQPFIAAAAGWPAHETAIVKLPIALLHRIEAALKAANGEADYG